MVRFQSGALWISIPSTKQPPGQRTNAGFKSAIYCARSGLNPLGRFLNVLAGNNDTKSSHTVPGLLNASTNFAFLSPFNAFNVALYFSQLFFVKDEKVCDERILPSSPSNI